VSNLDPASLQVLVSRLTGVAEEMGSILRRAAFSPNIKERADCSAALFTAGGELLVQAEHIPVHLGSMPAAVRAAIDACGAEVAPGGQIVLNDPYAGGTHLNDVTLVAPCVVDGTLVGWAANRAHHADLGGMTPGSMPPDATHIAQEGLRVPPVLLDAGVVDVVVASSRTPDERRGDLDAQVGANRLGVARLAELAGAPFDEVVAYGERRMRAALRELPDGRWNATDVIDSTGPRPEQQHPARITVEIVVDGDEITFDFTGSDDQRLGATNAVEAVTVSAVAFSLRTVTDPSIPANGGALRPVHVRTRPGSIVAATFPAAVGAGNVEVSQRVADVCLRALAGVVPDRVGAASQGTMNNLLVGGDGWVFYETIGGGQGGRPGSRPGMSGVHTNMTNTRDTPVEAFERAYPMRVRRYAIRRGSGGAGAAPGGDGIERELEALESVTVSLVTERRVTPPWGLAGGEPGAVGENWLLPGGDEHRAERLPDKVTVELAPGDVLRMLTPGGGGWGRDTARPPGSAPG
jgi:N-methylhydantoinase B/oxoprolinase/acetone carboxylase alpha subunit